MKRVSLVAASLALACAVVAIFAGPILARSEPRVYDACGKGKTEVRAGDLPRVVDQQRCPMAGRVITDGGVGAVIPGQGQSVFAEAASPGGDQQLVVSNPWGPKLVLGDVGKEAPQKAATGPSTRASGPSACRDSYYSSQGSKLYHYLRWYVNTGGIPSGMSELQVVGAIRRAGTNVSGVRNDCGIGDRVTAVLEYQGPTQTWTNIRTNATCGTNDFKSVVGFGDLPRRATGYTCVYSWIQDGPDRINSVDTRLNKFDTGWTTSVTPSCRNRWDVESTMTHERGHAFGLGDVPESSHGNLTMSSTSNGPCQTSERSLGRGDALGLNSKY